MIPIHLDWKGRVVRWLLARRQSTAVQMMGEQAREDLRLAQETHHLAAALSQDTSMLVILACVREARRHGAAMAEAGVFAGATARLICEEKGDAALHLFDVFETLQAATGTAEPDERAVRDHFRSTHATVAEVERLLAGYPGVHIHAGVFPRTAQGLEGERFCFVHLDLDLPEGTRSGLEFFHPRLVPGGILLGDDYHDPGVRGVFDAYFAGREDTRIGLPWGQVLVVKR
jgi:O-methyltransferase